MNTNATATFNPSDLSVEGKTKLSRIENGKTYTYKNTECILVEYINLELPLPFGRDYALYSTRGEFLTTISGKNFNTLLIDRSSKVNGHVVKENFIPEVINNYGVHHGKLIRLQEKWKFYGTVEEYIKNHCQDNKTRLLSIYRKRYDGSPRLDGDYSLQEFAEERKGIVVSEMWGDLEFFYVIDLDYHTYGYSRTYSGDEYNTEAKFSCFYADGTICVKHYKGTKAKGFEKVRTVGGLKPYVGSYKIIVPSDFEIS